MFCSNRRRSFVSTTTVTVSMVIYWKKLKLVISVVELGAFQLFFYKNVRKIFRNILLRNQLYQNAEYWNDMCHALHIERFKQLPQTVTKHKRNKGKRKPQCKPAKPV